MSRIGHKKHGLRSIGRLVFCLLAGCVLSSAPSAAGEDSQKVLTIAADIWCPINCAPDAKPEGIGIDLARQVFEPLGYEIRYVVMSWSRALEEVRAGRVDAVIGANKMDDPTLIFPKRPVYHIMDDFYVLAENPLVFETIESLAGQRIGVIHEYGYDEKTMRYLDKMRKIPDMVQEVGGDDALEQNIRKLLARHIDVVVETRAVMDYKLLQMKLEKKIRRVGSVPQGNVYLAFSPALSRSRDLARQFDRGVVRLQAEGTLAAMYKSYGLSAP